MRTHDDRAVGINGPNMATYLFSNSPHHQKYLKEDISTPPQNSSTTFSSISSLSTYLQHALYHLHSLKTTILYLFQPSSSYRRSTGAVPDTTGAVTGSTRAPTASSTRGAVSSFSGENMGFFLKFWNEEVGSVQTHLKY